MSPVDTDVSQLEARLDGIAHVLRDRRLAVPLFQRSYAWDVDQVDTFWSDLRSALLSTNPSYFLGTIVLTTDRESRECTIIDGQQRLATAAILIAAIRDEFSNAGDQQRAIALQTQYLTYRDLKRGGEVPRLTLNESDKEYFASRIIRKVGDINTHPVGASTRRLQCAYDHLRKRVKEEVDLAKSNWPERLFRWAEFLEYEVTSIVVDVPSASDAFLIFETLNDRGVALSVADLLKSYLYATAGDNLSGVRASWEATVNTLESLDDEQRLLDFLRQYWSSWYGAVRERDLYRRFRTRVRSPEQALELTSRISEASPNFLALVTGDATLWPDNAVTPSEAETLHLLQLTQNRPLLLAAMDHFDRVELERLALSTINWMVRGIVVGGIGGGTTERYFCDAAVRIREGRAKTANQVFEFIQDIVASDEQFSNAASTMNAPRAQMSRYLLLAFERFKDGVPQPNIVSREEHENCSAQRVLPTNPERNWSGFPDEEISGWSRRLGNFALLERRRGARRADRTWEEMADLLLSSEFKTSTEYGSVQEWNPTVIQERQKAFAEAAPYIWPREL